MEADDAYHALPAEEVLKRLDTGLGGLSGDEVRRRLEVYGYNEIKAEKRASAFLIWFKQFKSPLILILIAATLISYVISVVEGEFPVDSILIFAIVLAASTLGFFQEYRAEKAIEALKRLLTPTVAVIRENVEKVVSAKEIVPGDIVVVRAGDRVVADCRLIEGFDLQVDEAPLTGESTPVQKQVDPVPWDTPLPDRRCMLFAGTAVTYGKGRAVVVATGMRTELGKIAREVAEIEVSETPLERRMKRLGSVLGKLVIILCILIASALIIEDLIVVGSLTMETVMTTMLFAIALAVAVIPEALPAIVTGTLAIGMREMAKRNALVRRMPAVETLGCVTVICSDKTGTLTKGEMTVRKIYVDGSVVEVTGVGYEPRGEIRGQYDPDGKSFKLLMLASVLCNDAWLRQSGGRWVIDGDPTEGALVVAAEKAGFKHVELRAKYPRVGEVPFSSERKRMTTMHRLEDGDVAFMKGALEVVLERCRYIQEGGEARELTERDREELLMMNEKFASEALRNLAFAYRKLDGTGSRGDVEEDMVFLGIVGMIDPPREEAIKAVEVCKRVGIKTVMITGDHKLTALAIAKQMGIYRDGDIVLTGEELEKMSDEELAKIVDRVTVYARVSPIQKLKIVRAWKSRGEIVAMTGDGVNDAPAVKQADIGVAMGVTGTEVTKEASDMILLDDNFATIVKAIELGRWIYDNIKKYLVYLLESNIVEIAMITVAAIVGTYYFKELALPLLPVHILYINLATDGLPALALGIAPPDPDVMKRPPRNPRESIFSGEAMPFLITIPAINTPILLAIYFYEYAAAGPARAMSMVFLTFVFLELVVAINCRSLRFTTIEAPPHKLLIIAVLWEAVLISILLFIPASREALNVVLPTFSDMGLIALICGSTFVLREAIKKLIVVKRVSWAAPSPSPTN
ncbi:MAG: cation-translocating P-type ATPase [Nitrososphaerota archaeon]|nr:cation-translocating P-type ATPase [Nitrososphaerota archaeon]